MEGEFILVPRDKLEFLHMRTGPESLPVIIYFGTCAPDSFISSLSSRLICILQFFTTYTGWFSQTSPVL